MEKELSSYTSYCKHYDSGALWEKISKVAKSAGVKVIYATLLLYYVATSPETPFSEKVKIWGALGYFILPTDFFPDVIPVIGYVDDLTALLWTLESVRDNINPIIEMQAYNRLTSLLGPVDKSNLKLF
jgi:uncharacterized membrane protein YkvA (DUF1232 family)